MVTTPSFAAAIWSNMAVYAGGIMSFRHWPFRGTKAFQYTRRFTLGQRRVGLADHHASVAVAHEAHIGEPVARDELGQRTHRVGQPALASVVAGTIAGERRAVHGVAAFAQVLGHRLEQF